MAQIMIQVPCQISLMLVTVIWANSHAAVCMRARQLAEDYSSRLSRELEIVGIRSYLYVLCPYVGNIM